MFKLIINGAKTLGAFIILMSVITAIIIGTWHFMYSEDLKKIRKIDNISGFIQTQNSLIEKQLIVDERYRKEIETNRRVIDSLMEIEIKGRLKNEATH